MGRVLELRRGGEERIGCLAGELLEGSAISWTHVDRTGSEDWRVERRGSRRGGGEKLRGIRHLRV